MESTSINTKVEEITLDTLEKAVASVKKPDVELVKLEVTQKDWDFIKTNIPSTDANPFIGIPVILNKEIKKSRFFFKKNKPIPFCMRCGKIKLNKDKKR